MASLISSTINHLVTRQRDRYAECTIETCPLDTSYYFYRVNLAANATFIALFGASLVAYILTYALTRRATAFSVAMISGVILECLGYGGRIASWSNQWKETGFLLQIVCLTIAPAFMAGGIYLCLRRIVYAFGPENSRISPEAYTRIFIPCDLISLLLQAAGGGLASSASHAHTDPTAGNNIMIAGLAFQVLTLFIFIALCVDFSLRTYRRYKSLGASAFDQNPLFIHIRSSKKFKCFLAALALATICIFWRSVYRVAELAEGWTGSLIKKQWLFVGFEGVMVIVACGVLNIFHPALAFEKGMEGMGGIGSKRKAKKEVAKGSVGERSGSNSDAEKVVGAEIP